MGERMFSTVVHRLHILLYDPLEIVCVSQRIIIFRSVDTDISIQFLQDIVWCEHDRYITYRNSIWEWVNFHLCENSELIDKNSAQITKNYTSIFYVNVKTLKTKFVILLEPSCILTFNKNRWNHNNEFYNISLTCFFTPDPPLSP